MERPLIAGIKALDDLARQNRERYNQRLEGVNKKTLAKIDNALTTDEGRAQEYAALRAFRTICSELQEQLEALAGWARQIENDRKEILYYYGNGGERTVIMRDREKHLELLCERLRAVEVD
jgi:hypothetical protein